MCQEREFQAPWVSTSSRSLVYSSTSQSSNVMKIRHCFLDVEPKTTPPPPPSNPRCHQSPIPKMEFLAWGGGEERKGRGCSCIHGSQAV